MEQMFHIVSEVEHYKEFVPWCTRSDVFKVSPESYKCTMEVGFPPLLERYSSLVTVKYPKLVKVSQLAFVY